MYNFVFWFFYKFYEWKDKDDSTFIPATLVIFSFIIHLFLFYSIYRFTTHTNPLGWGTHLSYGQRKYLMLPFVILLFLGVWYFYYRKRSKAILMKYEGKRPFTIKNILLIVLIMVVPLIIAIRLTNMSL